MEYKGKQDLYKQQAPEILENIRRVATADYDRIKDLVEEKTDPENRSESEIAAPTFLPL